MSRRPFFSEPLWQAIRSEQQGFSPVFAWGITSLEHRHRRRVSPRAGALRERRFLRRARRRGPHRTRDHGGRRSEGLRFARRRAVARFLAVAVRREHGGDRPARSRSTDGHSTSSASRGRSFFGVEVGRSFDVAVPLCAEPLFRGDAVCTRQAGRMVPRHDGPAEAGMDAERAEAQLAAISPGIFQSTVARATTPKRRRTTWRSSSPRRRRRPASPA